MIPQRERCRAMWEEETESLMDEVTDVQRKTVVENSTTLGRTYMNTSFSAATTLGPRKRPARTSVRLYPATTFASEVGGHTEVALLITR